VDLHVMRAGEGPPVVLLHGFPENWRSWRRQVEPLVAAGYSVWLPDLRGYNLSERPAHRSAYRLRHLVADAAAVIRAAGRAAGQAAGRERAHLGGHDWGGVIAWLLAEQRPQLVDRLVIANAPNLRLYREELRRPRQAVRSWYVLFFQLPWLPERVLAARDFGAIRHALRRAPSGPAFTPAEIEAYVDALRPPGALTAALDYYRANFPGRVGGLRRRPAAVPLLVVRARDGGRGWRARAPVEAPTLVLWGERDPALTVGLLDGLDRVAPGARVHRIPSAGHWVQNEAAGEVTRALLAFLAR
jgi:epoxide hydrolase 4